jgi:hypothetical protein
MNMTQERLELGNAVFNLNNCILLALTVLENMPEYTYEHGRLKLSNVACAEELSNARKWFGKALDEYLNQCDNNAPMTD